MSIDSVIRDLNKLKDIHAKQCADWNRLCRTLSRRDAEIKLLRATLETISEADLQQMSVDDCVREAATALSQGDR